MKQYRYWPAISCGGVIVVLLHLIGRYIGAGINMTASAPKGLYIYYPIYSDLKDGDLVDFSLTTEQQALAHQCIRHDQYGLKIVGARSGERLITYKRIIYSYRDNRSRWVIRLGKCLKRDYFNRLLKCRQWQGEKIPKDSVYLRSVERDKHGCDSRYFGLVPRKRIYHRLILVWRFRLSKRTDAHNDNRKVYKLSKLSGLKIFFSGLLIVSPIVTFSAVENPWYVSAERGFWFYQVIKKINRQHVFPLNCKDKAHWSPECGFIDPSVLHLLGKAAYQFEQQQYHALLNDYALRPNNLTASLHWQQFNQWVIQQSVTAAYAMQFTLSQHPELDNAFTNPFSQFGRLVLRHIKTKKRMNFFHWLAESSFLVFFSRSECPYCQAQAPIIHMLSEDTGIPVWNASLDHLALPTFTRNMTLPATLQPARLLKVHSVPTIFLYLPRQKSSGIWLRLATGLTSEKTLEDRIVHFVLAYRHALLDGMHHNASPDFSHINIANFSSIEKESKRQLS